MEIKDMMIFYINISSCKFGICYFEYGYFK